MDEVVQFIEEHDYRARASALQSLLTPYTHASSIDEQREWWPKIDETRLADVPPEVAAQALDLLPLYETTVRLNFGQPPMDWMVEQAADLGGHLSGTLRYAFIRFSGITVPARATPILAARVATWPAIDDLSPGLACAQGSAWTPWSKETPHWTGPGSDLVDMRLPLGITEVSMVWH
ncbi:MAG TPA: hypothetical protein VN520_18340 [Streptomyces sp.]|uniref:hypothetical protein n=1 Tax=Streptomyces sp. TaxID=1931 RepID=UPI002B891633|nr:hypothetical protein [Streptomyces sp.]HWU08312.1 hypothetical protein [Streptomyces sp.]HWU08313.1 hypothetical protein [Streptomyces sp.]